VDDSFLPEISIKLSAAEASEVVDILRHLAALIDPDDPYGLRDARERRSEELEKHLLTDMQFVMLRHPAYREDDRCDVARYMRIIASDIEGQLPDEAPQVWQGH
jgi:hypothetical protein